MEQLVRQKAASRVVLDGATLVPEQVYTVAHDPAVTVEPSGAALKRVRASNALVKAEVEQKVVYGGKRSKTARVIKSLGIEPIVLMPKEGLSLINGTSMMTGIAALLAVWAERLVGIALAAGALALELVHGLSDALAEELHAARPHAGQRHIAARMRA